MSSRTPTLRAVGAVLAVGTVGLVADRSRALRRWRQERLAAHPDDHGLRSTSVWLRSQAGTDLHGWWSPVEGPAPAVLAVHGFASHAGDLLPLGALLHRAGFHVLLLDLRGHGRSERADTPPRPPVLAQDVRTAVDWLRARPEVDRVGVVGHSMGGSVSILAAAEGAPVEAIVSVAGVADPTLTRIGWWPAWVSRVLLRTVARRQGVDPSRTFARHRLPELEVPVLLVHGDRDRVVPIEHARVLREAAPQHDLLVVPGAGHASIDDFTPALDRAVGFLRASLRPD